MAKQEDHFAESSPRAPIGSESLRRPLDSTCEMAARLFEVGAASLMLVRGGKKQIIGSHGIPVKMRSLDWDQARPPYGPNEQFILTEAAANPFARYLFAEFGLAAVGSLIRKPVVQTRSHEISLLVLGEKAIAKPSARKLKLLDEIVALAKAEIKAVAKLVADPHNDVTVPLRLAEVEHEVAVASGAAFLLNAELRIVAANGAAAKLTGVSHKKLIGMRHDDITEPTADAVNFLYRRALETLLSPPDFEVIVSDSRGRNRVYRLSVTPFSPTDTRDYFLFVLAQEVTSLVSRTEKLSNAIDRDHGVVLPLDPTHAFLMDTLVKRRAIRQRKTVNYLSLRGWRQPIRDYQIKALKALKQNIPPEFPKAIASEIAAEVESLFGKAGFKAIVPMPCGHSRGDSCLSLEVARALGAELSLPVIPAFIPQPLKGASHPKENAKRPPLALAHIIDQPVLLIDDVATSGAHIEEAVKLLKPTCKAVMAIAWISGDAADKRGS
jgi:PAS domain S-box-containing protein